MSAVADKLREARALVERGWCKGDCAVDMGGRRCSERDAFAVRFDPQGAMSRVSEADYSIFGLMTEALRRAIQSENIAAWNDAPERTQAEVLAAFDRAIELAEQESAS